MAALLCDPEPEKASATIEDVLEDLKGLVLRGRATRAPDVSAPPLRIELRDHDMEAAPATLYGVCAVLVRSLDDVLRIWWGNHFMVWWKGR